MCFIISATTEEEGKAGATSSQILLLIIRSPEVIRLYGRITSDLERKFEGKDNISLYFTAVGIMMIEFVMELTM